MNTLSLQVDGQRIALRRHEWNPPRRGNLLLATISTVTARPR